MRLSLGEEPVIRGQRSPVVVRRRGEKVLIHSDRFGAHPIYYSRQGTSFRVATSLKVLASEGLLRMNSEVVESYMQGEPLGADTFFVGVRQLLPRRLISWDHGAVSISRRPLLPPADPDQFLSRLRQAVQQMAPAAVLLSGGLDSAVLLALLAEVGGVTSAWSVNDGGMDGDLERARELARQFKVDHHVVRLSEEQLVEGFEAAVLACEAPIFNHRAVSKFLLYKEAAKNGVTRLLSGVGADEVLMGNPAAMAATGLPTPIQQRRRLVDTVFREATLPLECTAGIGAAVEVCLPYLAEEVVAAGWYADEKMLLDNPIRGRRATEADSKHRFPVLESRPTEPGGPGVNRELGKRLLRRAVRGLVPDSIRNQAKVARLAPPASDVWNDLIQAWLSKERLHAIGLDSAAAGVNHELRITTAAEMPMLMTLTSLSVLGEHLCASKPCLRKHGSSME
ncbi:MAG: hypothetical protein HN348_19865 [Proteobacteria bacterium]|nr:hypothetical protein [Pseudomonadota bacterium]